MPAYFPDLALQPTPILVGFDVRPPFYFIFFLLQPGILVPVSFVPFA